MDRLLIIGCGDIARRALAELCMRFRVVALVRAPSERRALAALGIETLAGDLDDPASLAPLAGVAERVIHLAPPGDSGRVDRRTRNLLAALGAKGAMLPQRLVYLSTSGVYGDCGGERVDEDRTPRPATDRAARRADAERAVCDWTNARGVEAAILRVPGIYAATRLPLERLRRGTPVLRAEDDVYTNHIHADDLAAIAVAALDLTRPPGIYNASDDTDMKMGDWFDLLAERFGLQRPPRVSREQAARLVPPELLSFMSESRRLVNRRLKERLGIVLRYPTVFEGVPSAAAAA